MFGYIGKVLRINLTNKVCKVEALDVDKANKFIGARGLGVKILVDEVDPKIDALSPENKLIVTTGPLTGTPIPASGRLMMITKAPLTNKIGLANLNGRWGAELKRAGYDMIIIEGKSEKPIYINIEDNKVEIKDAEHLWGKLVSKTIELVKKDVDVNSKVLCIGPAGEELSPMAVVMNSTGKAAGRGGFGAVMGSKNLKAIVVKGSGKIQIFDEKLVREVTAESPCGRCPIKCDESEKPAEESENEYGIDAKALEPVRNRKTNVSDNLTTIIDSLGLCVFTTFGLGLQGYVKLYNAVVGKNIHNADSLTEAGDRIIALENLFNSKSSVSND